VAPVGVTPIVPSGSPGASQCLGAGFCDDRLEGLPRFPAIDLIGVAPGESCLTRPRFNRGLWQHDESRATGSDYVGPLARLEVAAGEKATYGHPMLFTEEFKDYGNGYPEPIIVAKPQDVGDVPMGDLAVMTRQFCEDGTQKHRLDRLAPEDFPADCPSNFYLLGYAPADTQCGATKYPSQRFHRMPNIKFPKGQVNHYTDADLLDPTKFKVPVWKVDGDCAELASMPLQLFQEDPEVVLEADDGQYVSISKSGVAKKLAPAGSGDAAGTENVIVGYGGLWQRVKRGLMFYPLSSPATLVTQNVNPLVATTHSVAVPAGVAPAFTGQPVWGVFDFVSDLETSVVSLNVEFKVGDYYVGNVNFRTTTGGAAMMSYAPITIGSNINIDVTILSGAGRGTYTIRLIGFMA